MTLKSAFAGASLIALSAFASAAGAQVTPAAPQGASATSSRSELGTATIAIVERYDSNVGRAGTFSPVGARVGGEDFSLSPTATVSVARRLGRHQVGLEGTLAYTFYRNNKRLNRESIFVQPYANLDLPVCDLGLNASVSRKRTDLADILVTPELFDAAIRNDETLRQVGARLTCGEEYGLRPTFDFSHISGRNSELPRQISDFNTTQYQPGLAYSSPALGQIGIFAVKTETEQPNRFTANGLQRGFSQRGAGVSYSRAIGTRLNFRGSLSWVEVQPFDPGLPARDGLNTSIGVTAVVTPRLQLVGSASRAFNASLSSLADYELAETYGLSGTYAATDRLRFRMAGSVTKRDLVYGIRPTVPFISEQTLTNISAGATLGLPTGLKTSLDAGYRKRTTDLGIFDYDGYFVALSFQYSI